MTESHPDPNAVAGGELRQALQLIRMACAGLLDQHVHAGGNRRARDFHMRIGRSRDDHRVEVGPIQQFAPVTTETTVRTRRRKPRCAGEVGVDAMNQPRARQIVRPLLTDRAATDESYVQSESPQLKLRSPGTMRRKV